MRKTNALKNILSTLLSYVFLLGVGILVRKLLLNSFDSELVGYENSLADLFNYVAIFSNSLSSLLTFRFYEAFASNDTKKLNLLASIYKTICTFITILSVIVCTTLFFMLPIIFKDRVTYWNYFNIMFILLALKEIVNYYFGYWRIILSANQLEYKAIKIETIFNFSALVAKTLILLTTQDFLLYIIISCIFQMLSIIFVYIISKKNLSTLDVRFASLEDIKQEGVIQRLSNIFILGIGDTIVYSSTSLFISLFININLASYFYNYVIFSSLCYGIVVKVTTPFRSTLADLIYKESKETSLNFYHVMDFACYIVASILFCCYVGAFQQAIVLFFGEKYLLSDAFLFIYAFNNYIAIKGQTVSTYRSCFGEHDVEARYAIIASITSIVLAYIFSIYFGITGIITGLTIAVLIRFIGYAVIVIKNYYQKPFYTIVPGYIKYLLLTFLEAFIVMYFTRKFSYSFINFIICGLISVFTPLVINLIAFINTGTFKDLVNTAKGILFNKQ